MTNSDTIDIDGIGPVLFEKSMRAKHVVISVRISKGVRVAVPTRTSFKKALEFVYLKKEWIQGNLAKVEQVKKRYRVFRDASSYPDLLEQGLQPHKVKEVLICGTEDPNYYVNITDTIDIKIAALRCHKSQVGDRPELDERMRQQQS